jgi:hypothetical protein
MIPTKVLAHGELRKTYNQNIKFTRKKVQKCKPKKYNNQKLSFNSY